MNFGLANDFLFYGFRLRNYFLSLFFGLTDKSVMIIMALFVLSADQDIINGLTQ
ncbi:MAG: hypothetical protein AB8W37_02445 [Arsenophonus endosymbiont of Dermacentor nuttalli]